MSKTASSRLTRVALLAGLAATIATIPVAAQAQRGRWGGGWGGGWGAGGWNDPWGYDGWGAGSFDSPGIPTRSFDPREGKISVSRFLASPDAAQELGHGMVTIASDAAKDGAGGESDSANWVAQDDRQTFEAAVIDSLVGAGYDTTHPHADTGQSVEVRVSRHELAPAEQKKNPISGSAAMGVSNYGSAYGLAINVDLSKPRSALVSTRLDVRILDKATGKPLWEGYATIATRDGDDGWTDTRIANRLSEALFDNFPKADTPGKP